MILNPIIVRCAQSAGVYKSHKVRCGQGCPQGGVPLYTVQLGIEYIKPKLCVYVCVRDNRARSLLRPPKTRCGCWGNRGSGYSGVDVARLAVRRELSFHFRFFLRGRHFLFIVLMDFRLLSDLIRYRPTFEFKPMIINF